MPGLTADDVKVETTRHGVSVGGKLAVAVSGGADSLALLLLASEHFDVVALTVDHGLRQASAAEAAAVADLCLRFGIAHETLLWRGEKPTGNIQAAAREARYSLMAHWCQGHGICHLATAHHRDDQAETLLLRLARGSGVYGLAAMAPTRELVGGAKGPSVTLIRPLLPFAKSDLTTYLTERSIEWAEDPSNQSLAFDRVKIRGLLANPPVAGLHGERLAATAGRLRRTRDALEHYEAKWLGRAVQVFDEGYAVLDRGALQDEPEEIILRGLASLCRYAGKGVYVPRMEKLLRLFDQLSADGFRGQTLYGTQFIPLDDEKMLVSRELAGCQSATSLAETSSWDNRFEIFTKGDIAGLEISALGEDGWRQLKASGFDISVISVPRQVALVLPAIYQGADLRAVPQLGYSSLKDFSADIRPIRTIITKM